MNKLLFAYEWNSNHVTTLYNKKNISNGAHNRERYMNFRSEAPELFRKTEIFPEIYEGCQHVQIDSIPEGEKYCYNIPVKNFDRYFVPKFENGFDIHERVRNDVINRNALIIIDYHFEGHLKPRLKKFNEILSKLGLPKERVLVLHGDHNVKEYDNSHYYNYEPVDIFPPWIKYTGPLIEFEPEKIFVSYNRILGGRLHRQILLANLYKHNLLSDGYVSIGNGLDTGSFKHIINHDPTLDNDCLTAILNMENTSPDSKIFKNTNEANLDFANKIDISCHINSFVSLVSETLYQPDISFFSEKIYKPIAIGHPFIINGNPRSLHRLRAMGFKTFSQWWDESYDNIENFTERIHAIIDLLKSFVSMSESQLITIRKEMLPVLEHNQLVFNGLRDKVTTVPPYIPLIKKYL